jgi:hypothetical protein
MGWIFLGDTEMSFQMNFVGNSCMLSDCQVVRCYIQIQNWSSLVQRGVLIEGGVGSSVVLAIKCIHKYSNDI